MQRMGEFRYEGHRISYDVYGEGKRLIVLTHGLLMNRHMFDRLAPELAERGNRVVTVDMLGHGRSDRPEDLRLYSMPLFARQVVALLDHLEEESAVIGGTSLGANIALELAVHNPDRATPSRPSPASSPRSCSGSKSAARSSRVSRSPCGRSRAAPTSPTSASTSCASGPGPRRRSWRGCCWGRRRRTARSG